MSFFKSLTLAILATVFLTYVFGVGMLELMNLDVVIDGETIEPLKAIGVSALIVVLLVVIALTIVLSVFGSLIFIGLVLFGSIAMVAVGVFWPIFLIAVIIWLFSRNKNDKQYA
jgi:pilus assembly protein TadC